MEYRRFGATEMIVSEIGFGCARLGGILQNVTKADMVRMLRTALDQGITFYDTSDMYCQGESEELLGQAFRGRRGDVIIASKVGYCLPGRRKMIARAKPLVRPVIQRLGIKREHLPTTVTGSLSLDFSPGYIMRAVEHSLRRLRTDYLDLYQLHSPPSALLESGDFLAPLERLKEQGKIRAFGVSCETTHDALVCLRYPQIASLQVRLSLLDQSALVEAVPSAAQQGVAIIARECFGGGLLAKPLNAPHSEGGDADDADDADDVERDAQRREMAAYARIGEESGRTLAQTALRFVSDTPGVAVTLLGMRTEAQLWDNLRLLATPRIAPVELGALREVVAAGRPVR